LVGIFSGGNSDASTLVGWCWLFDARGVEILLIKIDIKQDVAIDLPVEKIFAYISDLANLTNWSSAVMEIKKSSPGAVSVGATLQAKVRVLGLWLDITFEIIECDPNHYLTIKSVAGVSPCLICYQFESVAADRTIVSQEIMIHHTEGLINLSVPVIKSVLSRQLTHDLLTLKEVLEDGSSPCSVAD
jgi:uncharacterized membrane protein